MDLDPNRLGKMARALAGTREDEIGCDDCFAEMDRFAEMILAGKSAKEVLPLVHQHLKQCADCREEFEALLDALAGSG